MPKVSLHWWLTAFGRLNVPIALLAVILPLLFIPQAFCFERPKDFRKLRWGTQISQIEGLVLHSDQSVPNSKTYTRPSDSLEIAGGKVDAILYCFVDNRLTKVIIHFKTYEQFLNMKSVFLKLYGPPDKQQEVENKKELSIIYNYSWYARSDDEANVNLTYNYYGLPGKTPLVIVAAMMEWKGSVKGKSGL